MLDPHDTELTPEQRLEVLAALLARGVRRYCLRRRRHDARPPQIVENSSLSDLEVLVETRLTVSQGNGF